MCKLTEVAVKLKKFKEVRQGKKALKIIDKEKNNSL